MVLVSLWLAFVSGGAAQTEQVLYQFTNGADGADPIGTLAAGKKGNFYGTTLGGPGPCGGIFELSAAGVLSVLWTFQAQSPYDGCYPYGGLITDKAGNLYGTTAGGGAYDSGGGIAAGAVFELSRNGGTWTEKILWSFCGTPQDGCNPRAGLTLDSAGNLYGTTYGTNNEGCQGSVFELSPNGDGSWSESVLHSFACAGATGDGYEPLAGVTLDSQGNIYGTTPCGGAQTNCLTSGGTVFELEKASGWSEAQLHVFTGGPGDGYAPYDPVIVAEGGEIYGSTGYGGNSGNGIVFKLTKGKAGWNEKILYSFAGGTSDGSIPKFGLTLQQGHLYGVTTAGGGLQSRNIF
jgi:uncharacterized repeat protein (TIGR03803 family)